MPRAAAAKAPAAEPADPLADLREEGDRYGTPGAQEGAQDGPPAPGEGDPLATLLGEAVGAASVCWEPKPEGVFQPEQASAIVDDLLASLRPMLDVQATDADAAVERWHADTVAVGFLHKGGRCGCAYLARVILGA
jgi:hypothetical protein